SMPTFQYQSPASNDTPGASSVIDAPDRATAVRLLIQRGITPTRIDEVSGSRRAQAVSASGEGATARKASRFPGTSGMTRGEMASFVRELATAVEAGLPLIQALKTIQRSGRSPKQKAMLGHIISQVESNKS